MEGIKFRWIVGVEATDQEWQKIDDILATRGWTALNRQLSRIRVAEDAQGNLLGFLVLQLLPHTEPLFVRPSERGSGIGEQLAKDMLDYLVEVECRGWMLTADSPHAQHLAEAAGMVKIDSPVYRTM